MKTLHQERQTRHGESNNGPSEKMAMHKTQNDLPQETRQKMCQLLNARLADCTDLSTQVKTAHWNVKGPQFIALHKLFDEIYEDVAEHADAIAERCMQLGGSALGTARLAAHNSKLDEYPIDIFTCEDHVREVSKRLAQFGQLARQAIDQADEAQDRDTADLFTEISREMDQWLWFVEAHQQADR